jgi:hypothetical protein
LKVTLGMQNLTQEGNSGKGRIPQELSH